MTLSTLSHRKKVLSMQEYRRAMEANVQKLFFLEVAYEALFMIPVLVLYFQEKGLSLHDAFILHSTFSLSMMVLEIPTGYLSDCWDRKKTLVVGSVFGVIGILFYVFCDHLWEFMIGEFLLALLLSFHSGTSDALLYDTLLELDEEHSYQQLVGKRNSWAYTSQALASIGTSFLALISLRATVWATGVSFAIGLLIALTLTEPKRHKLSEKMSLGMMWKIITSTLVHNRGLRNVITLYSVIATMTLTIVWCAQPYQTMIEIPVFWFGIISATMLGTAAIASRYVWQLSQVVGNKHYLMLISIIIVMCYFLLGSITSISGIAFLLVGRCIFAFLGPVNSQMINRLTSSETRATVISIQSFIFHLSFGVTALIVGYSIDAFNLSQTFQLVGQIGGMVLLVIFLTIRKIWGEMSV